MIQKMTYKPSFLANYAITPSVSYADSSPEGALVYAKSKASLGGGGAQRRWGFDMRKTQILSHDFGINSFSKFKMAKESVMPET